MSTPILWHSNGAHTKTGYGHQTELFVPRIRDLGYDIAVSAFYGINGSITEWNGIKVYPGGYTSYGMDVIAGHANDFFGGIDNGLIITLIDAWVLDAALLTRANVAAWTPVDHEPAPPHVVDFFTSSQATPIAMSKHGEQEFKDAGLEPLYVPHGVDTKVYAPRDQAAAKSAMGVSPDQFLVSIVAANKGYPSRKGFSQMIDAFALFYKDNPHALLYLHTEIQGHIQGVSLPAMCEAAGIPDSAIIQCDQYEYMLGLPDEHMVNMYAATDVLMNCSLGEGFGVPILEAQACGTPVIVTEWTAMRQVGGVGWKVGGQRQFTDQRSYQLVPNVYEIVAALNAAQQDGHRLRKKARRFALAYDADTVTEKYWKPVLEKVMAGIDPPATPAVAEVGEVLKVAA